MHGDHDSVYWRDQAEEARAIAEGMVDPGAREMMLRLASRWDEMAKEAERQRWERLKALGASPSS